MDGELNPSINEKYPEFILFNRPHFGPVPYPFKFVYLSPEFKQATEILFHRKLKIIQMYCVYQPQSSRETTSNHIRRNFYPCRLCICQPLVSPILVHDI